MNQTQNTRGYKRYLAFDIHREYLLVGGQDEDQEWVLRPRRVSITRFPEWAQKNLVEGDIVEKLLHKLAIVLVAGFKLGQFCLRRLSIFHPDLAWP